MNYNYFRTISDVGMSPPVFPESPSYLPNSMPHKISMENGDTEQLGNKEEGEICVGWQILVNQWKHAGIVLKQQNDL